jgi:outer membrane protein OmpA-like peptidoglycan-associated protein/tetratricopeptide (TPR) repeat protein
MKNIYLILLLLIANTTIVLAQNNKTKKADQHFERFEYVKAAEEYQKLLKKGEGSTYVFTQLANSYYYINDTKKAEPYYRRVARSRNVDAEVVYSYAQTLKANGKHDESREQMEKFAEMKPTDSRAKAFKANPNYVPKLLEERERYSATAIKDLNSGYSDFGGITYGNKIYFASARNTSRKNYKPTQEPFYDVYEATISEDKFVGIVPVKGDVNTKVHEANIAITPDGKRMYFDRNDYLANKYGKDEDGINRLNIYYAEMTPEGEWKSVQAVPFNNSEYSVGHPALSPNGNYLYFSSDMPGSMGGTDLYRVSIDAQGNFGQPENLGGGINTEGDEYFPFIGSDGTIYFSSNGHLGLGGFDVFSAPASGNSFGKVSNMGAPINSSSNDFGYKYDDARERGFVSSNREGNIDNIYLIEELETVCESKIDVMVVDAATKKPIVGARVDLMDANQNMLATKNVGVQGNTSFLVECDQELVLRASFEKYDAATATAKSTEGSVQRTLELRPIDEIIVEDKVVLNPIMFDFDRHNIKPQAALELDRLVELMKKYPEMVIKVEAHTDTQGNATYNKGLSNRRAQSTVQYVISKGISKDRITGEGFGQERPLIKCGANCTEEQHAKNRRSEFIIVKR